MSPRCQQPTAGHRIDVDSTGTPSMPATGHAVPIAVIDTGSAAPGVVGDRDSCILHGTAVASVIQQVAPGAHIRSLRHSDEPDALQGTVGSLVTAIDAAVAPGPDGQQAAKIINISMVACNDTVELRQAIGRAQSHGALIVASTGNTGQCEEGQAPYPAALPGVIAVGAVDSRTSDSAEQQSDGSNLDIGRVPAAYSSANNHAQVFASGGPVSAEVETQPGVTTTVVGTPNPFIGTSFAAPVVSATAALVWEILPQASADQVSAIILETTSTGGVDSSMDQPIHVVDTQAAVNAALNYKAAGFHGEGVHQHSYAPVAELPMQVLADRFVAPAVSYVLPLVLSMVFALVAVSIIVFRAVDWLNKPASGRPAMVRHATSTGSVNPRASSSAWLPTE